MNDEEEEVEVEKKKNKQNKKSTWIIEKWFMKEMMKERQSAF